MYDEANKISLLLDAGVDYVHIRKPGWSLRDVRNPIEVFLMGGALLGYIWNDDFSSSLEKLTVAIKNIRNNTGPGPE